MKIEIDVEFEPEQVVYLKTDPSQHERIVTEYKVGHNLLLYCLSCGTEFTSHYACEISKEKDLTKL